MGLTIKRLRRWILLAAGLLVAVVFGFVIHGRYRFRHIEKDLPGRLGINIQQTANGFSYSQSSQGHTLFTLKASKLVQLKAGHALLHEVDITMYGPPGSGRADRIYGSNFDYDQNTGVATSQGEVNIEIAGMGAAAPVGAANAPEAAESNTIHVRTSGLTFVQKTGDATTAQPVEFQLPRAAGSSVGANYNSKTGVLVLDSRVKITTSSNGKSAVVQATHATLLRTTMQAFLVNPTINYQTESGSSDAATVFFRKDGTAERVDAQGQVRLRTDSGATVNSDTARILMDVKNQPTRADLAGGVAFAWAQENDSMHGVAQEGTVLFATAGGQTLMRHAEFRRDVSFAEEAMGLPKDPRGRAEKQMQGQKVDVDFGPAADGQVEARRAVAQGNPVVTMRQIPSKAPRTTMRISGDELVATLGPGNALQALDGTGNTRVLDESTDGARDTSQGDVLHTTFIQQAAPVQAQARGVQGSGSKKKDRPAAPKMETILETAVQDGHVVLAETPAKRPGAAEEPATLRGWAGHAEYHAADQVLHLSGEPRITDEQTMQMSAELIDYHRDTQNAEASGNVKVTYTQQAGESEGARRRRAAAPTMGGNGPVHVIAERAAMRHATGETSFYGTEASPARMWQDADSLLAPQIELDQKKSLLKAWGENTGATPVVSASFVTALGAKHAQSVMRVRSRTLVYSDKERRGDFRGAVTAEEADGAIRADDAMVYLKPEKANPGVAGSSADREGKGSAVQSSSGRGVPAGNSQVDRIVATGHVVFTQPGRKGEGEKLVYTADDGKYVLTGTAGEPPKLWDRVHGTTTGTALIFNSQNDSVEVSGGKSSAVTETRAPR